MKTIYQFALAGLAVGLIVFGSIYIANYNSEDIREEIVELETDSSIVTSDAQKTASLVVQANGTIGNLELVSEENIREFDTTRDNIKVRMDALEKVSKALIPGSPLLSGREESNIKEYSNSSEYPILFKTENVKSGKPTNKRKITSFSESGPTSYDGVDVKVQFDSIMMSFTSPRDTSYDGTYTRIDNKETYDVTVTLAKSGDLWFVYDIENSENGLAQRFATWSGNSNSYSDNEKDEIVGEITTSFNENEGGE